MSGVTPEMALKKVVLPAPLGPMIPTSSPAAMFMLTASTAVAGDLQTLFNSAIGTSTITGFTAADDVFVMLHDSTNNKMVVLMVDVGGADTTLGNADVVQLIGTVDMTAANYALLGTANFSIIGT